MAPNDFLPLRRTALALVLLATLSGCATTQTAPVTTAPAPAPVVEVVPANDNLNAVLWLQGSVEYRLIAGQTWRSALAQLDKAIKSPDWDALPKEARDGAVARGLPMAVIVDVDETVLDNSIYQARLVANSGAFDEATWDAWVQEQAAPAVPGALPFAQNAARRGVEVFYISNRTQAQAAPTLANLKALGFPSADADHYLGKGAPVADCVPTGSDKGCRRRAVGRTHRVLLQVGDQLGDFVDIADNSPPGREAAVASYRGWIGERWFVLPNPTYGSWEPALFGNDWKKSEAQRREAKRAMLRVGIPAAASGE
ncbi:MAG: 5'-nucleotidase, lipoprotein e(P4) family [Arenimonas sp.]